MSDFNLPPGVTVNMLPGNRPEDEDWDATMEEMNDMLVASELTNEDVILAVEIGIEALNKPKGKKEKKK